MNPDFANQMLEYGGTLVMLGMPKGTEFGIDMNSWNVGDKFKGVKMIPPGIHFIYFSAVGKDGQTAPRTGFFHSFSQREIVVKHYNEVDEDIVDEQNTEQIERIRLNLKNMDPFLGAYPLESWSKWVSLTQHIKEDHLKSLQPLSGRVCSASVLINTDISNAENKKDCETSPDSSSCNSRTANLEMPNMIPQPGTELRFSQIPSKPYQIGASPQEISKYSIDSSYILECILNNFESSEDLLSEFQFAFICFLVGQVWDSWEHWRKLIGIICRAEDMLIKMPQLFLKVISSMHYQIQEVPEDLFVDIVENNNFLASALSSLFANIFDNALNLPHELVSKARKFKHHIRAKYKWDLSEEAEDEAPVIV